VASNNDAEAMARNQPSDEPLKNLAMQSLDPAQGPPGAP
jgi:hypothetical protein